MLISIKEMQETLTYDKKQRIGLGSHSWSINNSLVVIFPSCMCHFS